MAVSGHSSQIPKKLLFHCVKEVKVNYVTFCYIQSDPHLYLQLLGQGKSADCRHSSGPITAFSNVSRASPLKNVH